MNLSWIHEDALALHQSVSPATPYKRLQALWDSWYQIPLQELVQGNGIKHMLDPGKAKQNLGNSSVWQLSIPLPS